MCDSIDEKEIVRIGFKKHKNLQIENTTAKKNREQKGTLNHIADLRDMLKDKHAIVPLYTLSYHY